MSQRFTRWGVRKKDAEPALHARAIEASSIEVDSLEASLKASPPSVPYIQERYFNRAASIERRGGAAASRIITGLAIPYNIPIDLGAMSEIYAPGSFRKSIDSETDDQRALFNGNVDKVLGRKSAGTMTLWESKDGIHASINMPETSDGDGLLVSMGRGDIDQMGAWFYVTGHRIETRDDRPCRVVTCARLLAVGPCAFGSLQGAGCEVEQAIASAHAVGFAEGKAAAAAPALKRASGLSFARLTSIQDPKELREATIGHIQGGAGYFGDIPHGGARFGHFRQGGKSR